MAQPWSVRFMSGRGGTRIETFTVPAGRRAVVRHMTLCRWAEDAGAQSFLYMNGVPVHHVPTGGLRFTYQEVRFTAYAGEEIRMNIYGADWSYGVDGYLFQDPDGTPDDADNQLITTLGEDRPIVMPTLEP